MNWKLLWEIVQGALIGLLTLAIAFLITIRNARAAEVEYMVEYAHTSDIRRGPPFNNRDEATQEYLAPLGMTIAAGKHRAWEIDLSTGFKSIDCKSCWETGSKLNVRFYPRRMK